MLEVQEVGDRRDPRSDVVEAAARLLQERGAAAVTTRRVAEEAGVQAPTLYRLFGDKDGLLEAVAEHVLTGWVAAKSGAVAAAASDDVDPVDDLRAGWRMQVEFSRANPAVFALLSDPARASRSPAALAGRRLLAARVHRIALVGRLRVSEEEAAELVHAAGTGAILVLLAEPERGDHGLADAMLEAVLRQILLDAPGPAASGPSAAAVAMRAHVPGLDALTAAERALMAEWLDRVVRTP